MGREREKSGWREERGERRRQHADVKSGKENSDSSSSFLLKGGGSMEFSWGGDAEKPREIKGVTEEVLEAGYDGDRGE